MSISKIIFAKSIFKKVALPIVATAGLLGGVTLCNNTQKADTFDRQDVKELIENREKAYLDAMKESFKDNRSISEIIRDFIEPGNKKLMKELKDFQNDLQDKDLSETVEEYNKAIESLARYNLKERFINNYIHSIDSGITETDTTNK